MSRARLGGRCVPETRLRSTDSPCDLARMKEDAPEPVTVADREILAGRTISAIKAIRDHLGCPLPEAVLTYHHRCEVLRLEQPDAFAVAPEEH